MLDIIFECLRGSMVGVILFTLHRRHHHTAISQIEGWKYIKLGFTLLLFGSLIDITDNFGYLNKFVIIGDTVVEAFFEKVVGYLLGFMFLALGILRWLPKLIEHEESMKAAIKQSNTKVKLLTGLLPICASCKKIIDDAGYWTQAEAYIRDHSEADFTHGICPECVKKWYSNTPDDEG